MNSGYPPTIGQSSNKKTPPSCKAERRGRNREEADDDERRIKNRFEKFVTFSSRFTCDHNKFDRRVHSLVKKCRNLGEKTGDHESAASLPVLPTDPLYQSRSKCERWSSARAVIELNKSNLQGIHSAHRRRAAGEDPQARPSGVRTRRPADRIGSRGVVRSMATMSYHDGIIYDEERRSRMRTAESPNHFDAKGFKRVGVWQEQAQQAAERAAREAGQLLLTMQSQISARQKGPADLVTDADVASQSLLRERLMGEFPDFRFIGEEDAPDIRAAQMSDPELPCWIVDPLDGTTNYVHGLEGFCVSIALRDSSGFLIGVIYDPVRDYLFSGRRNAGAFRNGQRLSTSHTRSLSDALVAASFAPRVSPDSPEVQRFVQVLYRAQAVRRLGSAALNLAYVASGNLDAYWATSVKVWDVAAGWVLVREAGGVISSLDGGPVQEDRPQFAASAQSELHEELLRTLATG